MTISHFKLTVFGFAVLCASAALAGDPKYLSAVDDLPLAPGLVEDVDAGVSFDKPGGRIIEALARGAVSKSDVATFYRSSLPALGWKKLTDDASSSRWQRGGELLSVNIVDGGDPLVVQFSIAPE